jgi:hypothetical protein
MASRRAIPALACVLGLGLGCSAGSTGLAETKISPDKVKDGERLPRPGPKYPTRPGLEALQESALKCYNQALTHNPIFARGGVLLIRWHADAKGDLLSLDFVRDTFGGWEINAKGETITDCVYREVEGVEVLWSRSGMAPLRFSPQSGPDAGVGPADSAPAH